MASISALGIGSEVLSSDLVDQLVAAERKASDLRIEAKTARVEAKISAYGEIHNALSDMQGSLSSLAKSSTIQSTSATSSNSSVLTATTNTTAQAGTYRIEVDEIASAHSLASQQYSSVDDVVGTGTLTFKLGTTTYDVSDEYDTFTQAENNTQTEVEITSENNSLSGVRDAINNLDFGVTASVVYDGSGYRLLLTSDETGEESSMEISVSGDAGLQSLAYNSTQHDPNANMTETQQGVDASIRVNGLSVTNASNNLDQVIKGVTLNLTETSDSAVTLNVSRDVSDIADKLDTFVEKYNDYKSLYDELIAYDSTQDTGGILQGDPILRNVQSQIRSGLTNIVSELTNSNYTSLIDIGISTDQFNDFELTFNRSTFEAAMADDADSIAGLLSTTTEATDSQVKVVTVGKNTVPGTYDVNITQVATQGTYQGLTTAGLDFLSDVVISDINDQFQIDIDGTSKTVTLEQGSYSSGDDLALMLQNNINSTFSGQSVTVEFDADNLRFDITSNSFGSSSEVSITSADVMVADTLGLVGLGGGEAVGAYYNLLSDSAFGAVTPPANQGVSEDDAFDFSASTVNFDLTLTGTAVDGTYNIILDEDWSDILDVNGDITTDRNRTDVLKYIQSELNNTGLAGVVSAEFNSSNRLEFLVEPDVGSQSISITNTTIGGSVNYLGIENGGGSSGVTISAGTDFELSYSNRYGDVSSATITIPSSTYETSDELATEIQNQINADANIAAGAKGAMTENGSRSLASTVDFTTDTAQFVIDLNGTEYTIDVAANGADNLDSIQTAIDGVLGAGMVTASLDNNGLVLTTDATGSAQTLEVISDGIGATTDVGTVDLSAGVDFSASPAAFTLVVDGIAIDVTVDGDGTLDSNDAVSNLAVIQDALDTALANAEGGGEFGAGDVVARLDAGNQLYFETVSKNGTKTNTTFGADATIQISAADANANAVLGITSGGINVNGADSFGLDKGRYQGFDSQAVVSYEQNDDGNGRFVISFGNSTDITLSNPSLTATTQLGFSAGNGSSGEAETGVDVKGSINGVEAKGVGQYLTASDGNEAATNGYLLGGTGWDFSSAVVLDSTNNSLKVEIDGVESGTITLTEAAYASGEDLAAELESQINADNTLKDADKAVDVQYDEDTGIFGIFSVTKGSDSDVSVTEITSDGIDIFGFTTTTASVKGKDSSGEIDDASGLMLKITGTQSGDRGSVTYINGIMASLDDFLDGLLGGDGLLTAKEASLSADQEAIQEEADALDSRMEAYQAKLSSKFLYNDNIISQLNTVGDFLTMQFEAMINSNKK
jgi:flagellar capping protein FliD